MASTLKLSHWSETSPLRYRKEVLPAGEWPTTNGGTWPLTEPVLLKIADTFQKMHGEGVPVPLTKGTPHKDWANPSNKLGDIIAASVATNDAGEPALFVDVAFANEADRDLALKNDVSVQVESLFRDGKARVWENALRHVASTSAPVIPDLAPFMAIAASFNSPTKTTVMNTLLEALGVEDETAAIAAVKALQEKAKAGDEKIELSHSPKLVQKLLDVRVAELSMKTNEGKISAPVRDWFMKNQCDDKVVALELSHSDEKSEYDRLLEVAELANANPSRPTNGRSTKAPANAVALSHGGGSDEPDGLDLAIARLFPKIASRN